MPARPRSRRGDEQQRAIEEELDRARSELHARLGTHSVRHVCLPWGVSGQVTVHALERLGFESAIANRWTGVFAVRPGDHPFWLKRLPNRYVFALPGRGRRTSVLPEPDAVSAAPPSGPTQFGNLEANLRFIEATGILHPGARVLEIGSGTGALLNRLRNQGCRSEGVDVNAALIEESRQPGSATCRVQQVTGTALPFADGGFDIVMSFDVLRAHPRQRRATCARCGGCSGRAGPICCRRRTSGPTSSSKRFAGAASRSSARITARCTRSAELRRRLAAHGFHGAGHSTIPVVNQFFRDKIRRHLGWPGWRRWRSPIPIACPWQLRTNLYVAATLTGAGLVGRS